MSDQPSLDPLAQARQNIQANLVRAAKYGDRRTRNWSLFYFFRIMTQDELKGTLGRAADMLGDPGDPGALEKLLLDLEQPSLVNAGPIVRRTLRRRPAPAAPAPVPTATPSGPPAPDLPPPFFSWLKVLASADKTGAVALADLLASELGGPAGALSSEAGADDAEEFHQILAKLHAPDTARRLAKRDAIPVEAVRRSLLIYARVLSDPARYREVLRMFGPTPVEAGAAALEDSLLGATVYELLRQGAPAFAGDESQQNPPGAIRGEADSQLDDHSIFDRVPINIAFTINGLTALNLDPLTLASFPEPFSQGMAARAVRLGDTGPSAPANWDSEYGLPSLHGFFTGGFPADSPDRRIGESVWRRLRKDIAAFNDRRSKQGRFLRTVMGLLFRQFGLEIVRIELGQDPYELKDDAAVPLPDRVEHFGFRDGISQPFADLGLGDPGPGGGAPDIDGSWSPVAPGEIYLDLPDEDGEAQQLPVSPDLRRGGTYLVFRKLEQDVSGFRAFVEQQRPGDAGAQARLAAQFVGRWSNGTPLVLSPDEARAPAKGRKALLNDFRYAADDPAGLKCPLGAHIRRANPRDTGGRDEVKRHRILRRGMAYGGPLLAKDSLGDGEPRGLLFIAANSRIDLQFEVIQADWISNGEFLGQAGLGHCPLVGAHDGGVEDSFLEAGASAPVTGLPRFVVNRGGDYFFAPGVEALRLLADNCNFAVPPLESTLYDDAMGGATTPGLFDPDRLKGYGAAILASQSPGGGAVRVQLPSPGPRLPRQTMVFVGQHADVTQVLSSLEGEVGKKRLQFSAEQYRQTGARITRGYELIVGVEKVGPTARIRTRMYRMLCEAWQAMAPSGGVAQTITRITQQRLQLALRRTASIGRVDLVQDLAAQAAYGVVTELFGAPGPDWLTELAPALPFGSQHIASLPPDWLAAVKGAQPRDPGLTSMQIWSVMILADVLGNLQSSHEVWPFSHQAGSEMLAHIDGLLADAMARRPPLAGTQLPPPPTTLVDAFARRAPADLADAQPYLRLAAVILMELIGDTIAAIPATFGHILDVILANRIDLTPLTELLTAAPTAGALSGVERLIYEAERLNPILPVLLRRCETATTLASGAQIRRGEWVAALVGAADLDPRVFPSPGTLSLDPYIPGPTRDPANYLAFGALAGNHACWGRLPVAMPVLVQCVEAASRLENLRRIAGPAGQTQSLAGVAIGLPARFTRIAPQAAAAAGAPAVSGAGRSPPPR